MTRLFKSLLVAASMALLSTGAYAAKEEPKSGAAADKPAASATTGSKSSGSSSTSGTSATADKAKSSSSDKGAASAASGSKAAASSGSSSASDGKSAAGDKSKSADKGKSGAVMDLNTASEKELATLPQIGEARAKAIVESRPYARKDELVSKKIVPQKVYDGIKDRVIAKQGGSADKANSTGASGTKASTKSDAAASDKKK